MYGDRVYFTPSPCRTIVISDAKTPEDIADGINEYMGYNNATDSQTGWTWSRDLLYIKVHIINECAYVYMTE